MTRLPPRSTRTDTLFPYTTLIRSRRLIRTQLEGARLTDEAPLTTPHRRGNEPHPCLSAAFRQANGGARRSERSEEHTSELQSLMRISYAVFCLKKKKTNNTNTE